MPELKTFTCDVCGELKRDVNRWWIVYVLRGIEFSCMEFNLVDWLQIHDPIKAVACGEEHAQTLFARWLVTKSFEPPRRES